MYANRQGPVLTKIARLTGDAIQLETREQLAQDKAQRLYFDRLGVGAYAIRDIENNPGSVEVIPLANSETPSRIIYNDRPDVEAKERFANRAAELGWSLRLRFHKTWERVEKGIQHPDDECISLNEMIGTEYEIDLERQLSQPIYEKKDSSGKIHVIKQGAGTKSPDIYESVMYAFCTSDEQNPDSFTKTARALTGF
jgi:hypothetical protein